MKAKRKEMSEISKHQVIKAYLLDGMELSGIGALSMFNVKGLSSVINRLRNEGLNIKTEMYKGHAVYRLNK